MAVPASSPLYSLLLMLSFRQDISNGLKQRTFLMGYYIRQPSSLNVDFQGDILARVSQKLNWFHSGILDRSWQPKKADVFPFHRTYFSSMRVVMGLIRQSESRRPGRKDGRNRRCTRRDRSVPGRNKVTY